MRCYVINMPKEVSRLERTKHELNLNCPKLTWSIPPMFVASEMSDEQFDALYDSEGTWKLHNRDLSRGEIACALSHQSALKEFLKSKDECCLIVEDDVCLSPVMGDFLDGLETWMNDNKGIPISVLLSEAAAVRYWMGRGWIGTIKRTSPINIYWTVAYVVNRAGAETIIQANRCIHTFADDWTHFCNCGLRVIGTDKILATTFDFNKSESSLEAERVDIFKRGADRRITPSFIRRKWNAIKAHIRKAWWIISGVTMRNNKIRKTPYMRFDV